MKYTYNTWGTCSRLIDFEIQDGVIKNVVFTGGCNGNLQGIARLVEGMTPTQAIERLKNDMMTYYPLGVYKDGAVRNKEAQ